MSVPAGLLAAVLSVAVSIGPPEEAARTSGAGTAARPTSRVVDLSGGNAAGRPWVGEPISLSLKDADLREVLRSFARLTRANLVIDPRVAGRVTVELHQVPWDQALWVILKTHKLGVEQDGRIWTIAGRPPAPDSR